MVDEVKTPAPALVAAPAPAAHVNVNTEAKKPADSVVAPVQRAPVVELAGVPETPASVASPSSVGAAVPSTDHYLTDGSPNKETSSDVPPPPVFAPQQ